MCKDKRNRVIDKELSVKITKNINKNEMSASLRPPRYNQRPSASLRLISYKHGG